MRLLRSLLTLALPAALAAQTPAAVVPPTIPATLFGEVRSRSEWDRPGGSAPADVYTYLRTRLGVNVAPVDGVRIAVQFQDSRVFGESGNLTASNPDVFELHQAYLDLSGRWYDLDAAVRAGRQEIVFGNERLIGAVGWSNTGRSFDGIRATFAPHVVAGPPTWTATAFVATIDERGRKFGATGAASSAAAQNPDHIAGGAYATLSGPGGASLDATLVYDAGMAYRTFDRSERQTLDVRWRSSPKRALGVELEGALQSGHQRAVAAGAAPLAQQVSAWLAGARIGHMAADKRTTTAAIGVDILSGDAKPKDGTYSAFNTMFATNHPFYGLMDLFLDPAARTLDHGLIDVLGTVTTRLSARSSLRVELHHFAQQAVGGSEIGWESDMIVPVKLNNAATVELGYTAFRPGAAAAALSLGADGAMHHWAYLQLKAGF